jgi:hypothetical protein
MLEKLMYGKDFEALVEVLEALEKIRHTLITPADVIAAFVAWITIRVFRDRKRHLRSTTPASMNSTFGYFNPRKLPVFNLLSNPILIRVLQLSLTTT